MYIFSNIELLLTLNDIGVLTNSSVDILVTDISLDFKGFEYNIKEKLKQLIKSNSSVNSFTLGEDFFKFALKQQIKYKGLDIMAFACIYYAKANNGFLVTTNPTTKKCALDNGVSISEIRDVIVNISKEEKYVEFFFNK